MNLISPDDELSQKLSDLKTFGFPMFFMGSVNGDFYSKLIAQGVTKRCMVREKGSQDILALGHACLIHWNGTTENLPEGYDETLQRSLSDSVNHRDLNTMVMLAGRVAPDKQGMGLSSSLISAFKQLAKNHNMAYLIAPVRPNRKANYPDIPFDVYVTQRTSHGEPEDPWLRQHVRAGGKILKVAQESMRFTGSISQWREWTGQDFSKPGRYYVDGALCPVVLKEGASTITYVEPNVWIQHSLDEL